MTSIILAIVVILVTQYVFRNYSSKKTLIFGVDLFFIGILFFVAAKFFDVKVLGLSYGIIPDYARNIDDSVFVSWFMMVVGLIFIVVSLGYSYIKKL